MSNERFIQISEMAVSNLTDDQLVLVKRLAHIAEHGYDCLYDKSRDLELASPAGSADEVDSRQACIKHIRNANQCHNLFYRCAEEQKKRKMVAA